MGPTGDELNQSRVDVDVDVEVDVEAEAEVGVSVGQDRGKPTFNAAKLEPRLQHGATIWRSMVNWSRRNLICHKPNLGKVCATLRRCSASLVSSSTG